MDASDLHEVTFVWPDLNANEVILTGTFDNWSLSVRLTKTPSGFQGTVKLPWGSRTLYKYVVDGRWMTAQLQPQEADNAGNINSVYESPSKPQPPAIEGFANKPTEIIPEVVPELQTCISTDHTSPRDEISNVHTSIIPPAVGLEEKATDTHSEKLVSEEMSEHRPITSLNEGANLPTKAGPAIEESPSLIPDDLNVVSDESRELAEVERVDIAPPSDELPASVSEHQSIAVLPTKETVTSSETTSTCPATQDPIAKSALQTTIETIVSDGANLESTEIAARVEPDLVPKGDGSLQTPPPLEAPTRQTASSSIPTTLGERNILHSVVQKEETSPSIIQTVSDDSGSVEKRSSKKENDSHLFPAAPATSSKAERFPSSESMKDTASSSNSSKFNSVRKKRLSLFGKVKHFFLHDKDDEKD